MNPGYICPRSGFSVQLVALCAILIFPFQADSQQSGSRVFGTVRDAGGLSIGDANVNITDVGKKTTRQAKTGPDGLYQALQLPIGTYSVTVEKTGFRSAVTEPQTLNINQALRVDVTLQVGQVNETVEVNTQSGGVETVTSTLGGSVTSRPLVDLPLNGRNALDLALLQPGVTPTNEGSVYASTTGNANSTGGFSIAGGRNDSITYLLDGGLNNSFLYNDIVYNPNPDTIEEFRILTSNYNAEYGRNAGGVISIITKSGTNQLHGSVFDFLRNDALNANSFFSNAQGQSREILKRNQYGFSVGGPVVIPKVINGRNKLFFFGSYQGQKQTSTLRSGQISVFTPEELRGNFSRSNDSLNGPPSSLSDFLLANPAYQPNPALAAQGIIDPSRINSIAGRYIQAGLVPTSPSGFLFPRASGTDDRDEATGKVDWVPNESQRLTVTLGGARNPIINPFDGANVAGFPSLSNLRRYFANVALTSIVSPSLLNELRVTAQRQNRLRSAPGATLPTAADLGIGITPDNPTGPPIVSFSSGLNLGFSGFGPSQVVNNTYQYSDTVTWTHGRHTVKGGFSFAPYQNNTIFDFFVNGQFTFAGTNGQAIRTGNDRADFLLGLPDTYYQYSEAPSNIRTASYSGFIQDEWRVRPHLVLTAGLRYDYDTPRRDTLGRSFSIVPGQQSQRFPGAPPGLLFPSDRGAPNGANFPDRNNFGPRVGFAWDPSGTAKTSIRGGFGVFYDVLKGEDLYQMNGVAPFAGSSYITFDTPAPGVISPNPFAQPYAASGFPNPFPSRPPGRDLDFYSAFGPFNGYSVNPNLRSPYIYQYNLSFQQQMGRNFIAELNYVGNSAHKLTALVDPNPFVLGTTNRLLNTQPGSRPDSWALPTQFINGSNASYNSLQAGLQKRFSDLGPIGGVSFQLSYTLGHMIDDASGFEQVSSRVPYYNQHQFRASSDQDVRHYLAVSGLWDLPFDKLFGRNRLTRGWGLNPIFTYRSGQPMDVSAGFGVAADQPGPSGAGDAGLVRPNLTNPISYYDPRVTLPVNGNPPGNYWFDTSAFSTAGLSTSDLSAVANPAARTYGSYPRNTLRGPTRTNLDLRISKSTYLYQERVRAELLGEFFNIFNRAQFRNPDLSFNSSTFGIISQTYDPRIIQVGLKLYF